MSRFHKKRAHVFFKRDRVFLKHDRVLKKDGHVLKKDGGLWGSTLGEWVKRIYVTYFHLGRLAFRKLKRSDGSEGTFCIFQLIFYPYYTLPFS